MGKTFFDLIFRMGPILSPAVFYLVNVAIAAGLIQVSIRTLFNINYQWRRYWGIFLGILGLGLAIGSLINQIFFNLLL